MSNNLFVASDCTHDPAGGLPSISAVPACTYIDSSGQEFIDMETHQMDIDARDDGLPTRSTQSTSSATE